MKTIFYLAGMILSLGLVIAAVVVAVLMAQEKHAAYFAEYDELERAQTNLERQTARYLTVSAGLAWEAGFNCGLKTCLHEELIPQYTHDWITNYCTTNWPKQH
jgi:hypothetical protein